MVGRFDLNGILLLFTRHAPMPALNYIFPHRDEFTISTVRSGYRRPLFILQQQARIRACGIRTSICV